MRPGKYNLSVPKGDPIYQLMRLRSFVGGVAGDPIDLTGYEVEASAVDTRQTPEVKTVITVDILDPVDGVLRLTTTQEEADTRPEYNQSWSLRIKPPGGVFQTYLVGQLMPVDWRVR